MHSLECESFWRLTEHSECDSGQSVPSTCCRQMYLVGNRVATCDAIDSNCSRSVSSSSNHIWKECSGPVLGYWRCGISYGLNLTTCGSRYRNLAPPFASIWDAAGTLPGPRRAANRMEVAWINCATGYNSGRQWRITPGCQFMRFALLWLERSLTWA